MRLRITKRARASAILMAAALTIARIGWADLYVMTVTPNLNGSSATRSNAIASNGLTTGYALFANGITDSFLGNQASITDYGRGPFNTFQWGLGVNSRGNVSGFTLYNDTQGHPHNAAILDLSANPNNQFAFLGPFDGPDARAVQCSDRGGQFPDIAAYQTRSSDSFQFFHAYNMSGAANRFVPDFEDPAAGVFASEAKGCSNAGTVAGFWSGHDTPGQANGIVWNTDTGQVVARAGIASGGTYSAFFALSSDGSVAGGVADSANQPHAALFRPATSTLSLLPLSDPNHPGHDTVWGVNSHGRAVGQGGGMIPGYDQGSVGGIVWTENGMPVDLNSITVDSSGRPIQNSVFIDAFDFTNGAGYPSAGINDVGQIAASAYNFQTGLYEAVTLDPVGPASLTWPKKLKKKLLQSTTLRVTLNMVAPADTTVNLSTDSPGITFSTNPLVVPRGSTFADEKVTIDGNATNMTADVFADATGLDADASITKCEPYEYRSIDCKKEDIVITVSAIETGSYKTTVTVTVKCRQADGSLMSVADADVKVIFNTASDNKKTQKTTTDKNGVGTKSITTNASLKDKGDEVTVTVYGSDGSVSMNATIK